MQEHEVYYLGKTEVAFNCNEHGSVAPEDSQHDGGVCSACIVCLLGSLMPSAVHMWILQT